MIFDDGGLRGEVRVTHGGKTSVSFSWRYRIGGKVREIACGTWPRQKLSEIRKVRDDARAILADGKDPALERKAGRLEAKVKQQAHIAELEQQASRVTVGELYQRWAALELTRRKDGGKETMRGFVKDVLPQLSKLPAEDITRAHITRILDTILARGANRLANRVLSELRQMFGFGYVRGIVATDPTHRIKKADIGGKEIERDRVLRDDEIRELAHKLPSAKLYRPTEHAIWIMLSTCCRVGEISRALWEHVDFSARTWTIPPEHAKNAKAHTVFLSDFALRHFEGLKALATANWLFPAPGGETHVSIKNITKQIGDRQRETPLQHRSMATQSLRLAGGNWTPRDLRRTGATIMGELGVRPDVIERCLNHVEQNRMARVYQRQELKGEQAEAWRRLGERLELLTRIDADNVVLLSKRVA